MYQLSIHSSTWWRRIGSQECLFILWHHRNVMVANYLTTESIQDSFHPTLTHIEWREFLATLLSLAGCFPLPYIMTCLINVSYLCSCMWLLSLQMNKTLRLYMGKWSWYQCTPNSLSKWADKCSKVRKNAFGLGIYANLPVMNASSTCFGYHPLFQDYYHHWRTSCLWERNVLLCERTFWHDWSQRSQWMLKICVS